MMALPAMRSLPAPVLLALVCPSSASYVRETAGGKTEVKPHLLDEGDELWVELRHQHLVDVFNCLGRKGQELGKSKAAQQSQRKGEGGRERGWWWGGVCVLRDRSVGVRHVQVWAADGRGYVGTVPTGSSPWDDLLLRHSGRP